jgi:hypothetical protein
MPQFCLRSGLTFPIARQDLLMNFPRMLRLRRSENPPRIDDIPAEVERQLAALNLSEKVIPGQSVAITAGSGGIKNIAVIT